LFGSVNIKITEEMPIVYDIKTDYLYQRGLGEGMITKGHENKVNFVKKLLLDSTHTDKEIANFADVTIEFVQEIKKSIDKK
jgi:hypothetical protein